MLQRRLWLVNDSILSNTNIKGLITKTASFFSIPLHNPPYIPSSFLNITFVKNSKQFKLVNGIWYFKDADVHNEQLEEDLKDIESIRTMDL